MEMEENSAKQRKGYDLQFKIEVIDLLKGGRSQLDVAKIKGMSRNSVKTIWQNRLKISKAFQTGDTTAKRLKLTPVKYPDLDKVLFKWYRNERVQGVEISWGAVKRKAVDMAIAMGVKDFAGSNGWLEGWRRRYGGSLSPVLGQTEIDRHEVEGFEQSTPTLGNKENESNFHGNQEIRNDWNGIEMKVEVEEDLDTDPESNDADDLLTHDDPISDPEHFDHLQESHCLICLRHDPDPQLFQGLLPCSKKGLTIPSKVGEDMRIIHLLKIMFRWTTSELDYLLQLSNGQSPRDWIHICQSCQVLVSEIQSLEEKMRECRIRIKRMMEASEKSTWSSTAKETMTGRIRNLVSQETRSARDKRAVFRDGDKEAEKLVNAMGTRRMKIRIPSMEDSDNDWDMNRSETSSQSHEGNDSSSETCSTNLKRSRLNPKFQSMRLPKDHVCPMCPQLKTMTLDEFIVHLLFHWRHSNKCSSCNIYLPLATEAIEAHWKHHHPHLDSSNALKSEQVHFTPGDIFRCQECPEKFSTFRDRNEHELSHGSCISNLKACNICNERFPSANEVRLHKALDHPEIASVSCFHCEDLFPAESVEGVQYLDLEALQQHIIEKDDHPKSEAGKISFLQACELCGEIIPKIKRQDNLRTHMINVHGLPASQIFFSCFICNKSVRNLWTHLSNTHAKNIICETCGEEMRPRTLPDHTLNRHGVLMEGYSKLPCTEEGCHYATVYKDSMRYHVSVNHKERPRRYQCSFCEKAFYTAKNLKDHEERHRNKETRPYQCEICGNSYKGKHDLYMHRRMHHMKHKFPSTNRKRMKPTL